MYSQRNEDEVILRLVGDATGRFLDIGANDGRTFSNTHALALKGWGGICVEPSPRAAAACRALYQSRPDITVVQFAIGDYTTDDFEFWDFSDSLVSTTDRANMELWRTKNSEPNLITVKMLQVDEFAKQYPGPFEFVNLDAEGISVQLALQCPWDLWQTKIACIEYDKRLDELTKQMVYRNGFRLEAMTPENAIFAR